ncbi:hypothetical protein RKD55_003116 [Rossellomorea marisflavi]
MKTLKVQSLQEGISRSKSMLDALDGEIQSLKQSITSFSGMEEALKGKGGGAIRSFYDECHVPLLDFIVKFSSEYKSTLEKIKSELSTLEPSSDGYIHQPFLDQELNQSLDRIKQHTESLVADANSTISSISDIVSISSIQDSSFTQGVQSAKTELTETVDKLTEFDSSQSKALSTAEEDLVMMENWISDIEGLMQDGKVNVNFPTTVWKEYAELNPLTNKLNGTTPNIEELEIKDDKEKTGDVSGGANSILLTAKKNLDQFDQLKSRGTLSFTSLRTFYAARKNGLKTYKVWDPKKGQYGYRITATPQALRKLGVEPDSRAFKELVHGVPKGGKKLSPKHKEIAKNNTVTLKYATQKKGQTGWSPVGEKVLEKNPHLKNWNNNELSAKDKFKTIGKATAKGVKDSYKDIVDIKGIAKPLQESGPVKGVLKSSLKGLAPISAGLSFYENHTNAKAEGLTGAEATKRATVDTAIDVGVSSGVQTAFTAAGTALIPIPGVGTLVGMGAGIAVNTLLNHKFGKDKDGKGKSAMDVVKGWFR